MAVQPIKLNLVPEPSLWRERHLAFGWAALALSAAIFLGVSGYTAWSYLRANRAGQAAVNADAQTHTAAARERQLLGQLQRIDVDQELPRWRLAERILSERAAPWSRLAAELEQCLVDGTRLKDVERARGQNQALILKLKAESRTREAESSFIENLRKDPVFTQVALEREAQQPGGGWEYELSLFVTPLPPPFVPVSGHDALKAPRQAAQAPLPVKAAAPAPAPSAVKPPPPAKDFGPRGPARSLGHRPALGAPRQVPPSQRPPAGDGL